MHQVTCSDVGCMGIDGGCPEDDIDWKARCLAAEAVSAAFEKHWSDAESEKTAFAIEITKQKQDAIAIATKDCEQQFEISKDARDRFDALRAVASRLVAAIDLGDPAMLRDSLPDLIALIGDT